MTRLRAIAYLLNVLQSLQDEINDTGSGEAGRRLDRSHGVERLILDVRASRIHHFQIKGPPAVEIFITD